METVNFGGFSKTFHYEHYHNGLKKRFVMPDNTGYDYTYDDANQLVGVQIPGVGAITVNSYNWNRPDSISLPGGSKQEYTYDPLMRIKSITDKDPAQNVLMQYNYNYDKMDNITSKSTWQGVQNYTYDDLYRLTASDHPVDTDESFTYDAVGNRLTSADTSGTWTYNLNNELQSHDTVSYDYDANGNMIQKTVGGVVTKFFYNTEDRLSEVRDGSDNLIASYYYDPFGRRLWKEVSGVRTYFFYADEGLIGEYDASGSEIKAYGYKPGSTWTTNPLFMKIGTEYYFYQNDHLGTPQKMTAVNGAVVWNAKYSSFGKASIEIETVENNLRFPGQYYDQETDLHYNYFRYYDPSTGRYLKADPSHHINIRSPFLVPFLLETPRDINDYSYGRNNPMSYLDVLGLNPQECCYEFNWKCRTCTKRGPKRLDIDCFLVCASKYFPEYAIGGLAAVIMFQLGHPVLGGILIAAEVHHIYSVCYLPCKKCPMVKVVNF